MNNKNGSFKQKIAARGLYITAIGAFAVIIASVIISYYTTDRYDLENQTTTDAITGFTQQAQAEKNDVPDERTTTQNETTAPATSPQTSYRPVSTTEKTTVPTTEAQIVNSSFVLPCDGEITMKFSDSHQQYNQTMGDWRLHLGTDFAGEEGDNVYSVGNGKVTKVVSDTKWGYVIEIDHGTFTARYCGLKQDGAVSIGETVSSGTIIGQLTNIPIESLDGIHLHFEAVKDGKNVDPIEMIQAQTQTNN